MSRDKRKLALTCSRGGIDDYCNMDEDMSLSEPQIGVTRFALLNNKSIGKTYVGSRKIDLDMLCQEMHEVERRRGSFGF